MSTIFPSHTFPNTSPIDTIGLIRVFHPGYTDDCPLISFDGYDTTNGGIWRDVVTTACAIITNNRFDGQLRDLAGNAQDKNILPAGDYAWHVPGGDVYAVITSFREWSMPRAVPRIWRTTSPVFSLGLCSVLLQAPAVGDAYIVPEGEAAWFLRNGMGAFHDNWDNSIDHQSNLVRLSASLRSSFDDKEWAFFPKEGEIVVQVMERRAAMWSNQTLKGNVLKEYLLARFAWTLFPGCVETWLRAGRSRLLLINGKREQMSGVDCMNLTSAVQPPITKRERSESPRNSARANMPDRRGTLVKVERDTS